MDNTRVLLYLDILGFSQLVRQKGSDEVLQIITRALDYFHRWERLNACFKTIYFADTFLFYQEEPGYHDSLFYDIYALGGFMLTALLAEGIPARGAISYGEFNVHEKVADRHQVYFGEALLEAHDAEKKENWLGITILSSAWGYFSVRNSGAIEAFAGEGVWLPREEDQVLLLNPFAKLRAWHLQDLIGEITPPYLHWDSPEFPNEIRAFDFIRKQIETFTAVGDTTSRIASKYFATDAFLRRIMGAEQYQWAYGLCDKARIEQSQGGI
jgi:hypothetical protein